MEIQNNNLCTSCYAVYEPNDAFCNGCGFPLQGTQQEQNLYISERSVKEIDLEDLNQKVESACKSLYWIAGLMALSCVISYFQAQDEDKPAILITTVILVVSFLGLALWSKTKPATALISGLSLYLIIHILSAIVEPMTIFSGIIMKIIIIGYLIKGIKSVLEVDKLKKELNIQ